MARVRVGQHPARDLARGLTWTNDPGDATFTGGGQPTVIKDEGIYKMWYVRPWFEGIYYATSPDGRIWTEHGLSLPNGTADSWDGRVYGPTVLRDGGVLEMWYSGKNLPWEPSRIGYATYP